MKSLKRALACAFSRAAQINNRECGVTGIETHNDQKRHWPGPMVEDAQPGYDQERNQDEWVVNQASDEVGSAGNEIDIEVFPQQIIGRNFALTSQLSDLRRGSNVREERSVRAPGGQVVTSFIR